MIDLVGIMDHCRLMNTILHSAMYEIAYALSDLFCNMFARTVIDIHFFFDSIIDILFFDSDYFDSVLKNCPNRIFSHVPHYICG